MKKLILLFLILCQGTICLSQKIIQRKDDGSYLTLITSQEVKVLEKSPLFAKQFKFSEVGLQVGYSKNKTTEQETYALYFAAVYSTPYEFLLEQGSSVLIKTRSNQVFVFSQLTDNKIMEKLGENVYYSCGAYAIPIDIINSLINEGVSKIRVETTAGLIDYEFSDNWVAETINKELNVIKGSLDITAGF